MLQHLPLVNRLLCEPCLEGWLPGCSPGPAEPSPPGSPWNLGVKLGSKCRTWSHLPGRILCPSTVIAPSMALSRSAAWLQGALSSPALVCPCPRAKGLIHSPAEPWDSSGPETQPHESGPRASQFSSTLWIFVLSPAAFAAFAFIITCTSSSALSCSK